ncbi:unnamed protein product [Pleuronectes platessa]|uniref:Uncharacterized protein n=1 Tax=Pleuronectes platessa TaxID=8262 RepID=A0A9N7YXI0_PLEPL|nr:unnamed protein product [Pleuronectes platessa]
MRAWCAGVGVLTDQLPIKAPLLLSDQQLDYCPDSSPCLPVCQWLSSNLKPGRNSIVQPQWTWQNKLRPSDRQWLSKEYSWATTTRLCTASKIRWIRSPPPCPLLSPGWKPLLPSPLRPLLLLNKPSQPPNLPLLLALLPSNTRIPPPAKYSGDP